MTLSLVSQTTSLTASVTPAGPLAVGDLLVTTFGNLSPGAGWTISGGPVASWNFVLASEDVGSTILTALWWGVVNTTTTSAITWTGGGGTVNGSCVSQFHSTLTGGTWTQDRYANAGGGSATSGTYPSPFATVGVEEIYVTGGIFTGTTSGSTAGMVYTNWSTYLTFVYGLNVPTTYTPPTWSAGSSVVYAYGAVTIYYLGGTPPASTAPIVMVV
jgi:hypothetical protein